MNTELCAENSAEIFLGYDIFSDDKRPESEAGSHSSKSFELLKMPGNSGKTGNGSGHTSGDDLETFTTTSSDIEVISSPGFSEKSGAGTGGSPVTASRKGKGESAGKHFKKGKKNFMAISLKQWGLE